MPTSSNGRLQARGAATRLAVMIAAVTGAAPEPATAQTGIHGACTVSDASPAGPPIWSSASQSLWGCEGWVYAFAVRDQRVTYGRWNRVTAISVTSNGVALTAADGPAPDWKLDIVDYLQVLVDDGQKDIDGFWRRLVATDSGQMVQFLGVGSAAYTSPRHVALLADTTLTACSGIAAPNDAFYCLDDLTVYLGRGFLASELAHGGNFVPILILSHEWGHHIQNILGISPLHIPRSLNSRNIELQADCFAGLYAQDAARRGLLDPGDVEEAASSLYRAGDPQRYPWFAQGAHGTADERIAAWRYGQQHGLAGCFNAMFLSP